MTLLSVTTSVCVCVCYICFKCAYSTVLCLIWNVFHAEGLSLSLPAHGFDGGDAICCSVMEAPDWVENAARKRSTVHISWLPQFHITSRKASQTKPWPRKSKVMKQHPKCRNHKKWPAYVELYDHDIRFVDIGCWEQKRCIISKLDWAPNPVVKAFSSSFSCSFFFWWWSFFIICTRFVVLSALASISLESQWVLGHKHQWRHPVS